jgi:hypothetical protein
MGNHRKESETIKNQEKIGPCTQKQPPVDYIYILDAMKSELNSLSARADNIS